MARIVSFGSLNHDLSISLDHLPGVDETLQARSMVEVAGGKGLNQCLAAARLGAEAAMVGCLGNDERAAFLRATMRDAGIDDRFVVGVDEPTGLAVVAVADGGDVSIIVVPGANGAVTAAHADAAAEVLSTCEVLLLQGEVPAAAARRAAEIVKAGRGLVVFNPAPVNDVAAAVLPLADVVILNRDEQARLGRIDVPVVVTTLGAQGVEVGGSVLPAFEVEVVDPTGAGDAFCGAFAVALSEGGAPQDAVRFAMAAGACAVTKMGAGPSMPTRAQVDRMLERATW